MWREWSGPQKPSRAQQDHVAVAQRDAPRQMSIFGGPIAAEAVEDLVAVGMGGDRLLAHAPGVDEICTREWSWVCASTLPLRIT